MIILALDALDLNPVLRYKCKYLKQIEYGQVDVSDFKLLRTVVLWASFLSGENMEDKVPLDKEIQWKFKLEPEKTFLPFFETYKTIDVPAFSFKQKNHSKERCFMKKCFDEEISFEDFNSLIWRNHEENKKDFFQSLSKHDLVMGYFNLADTIGHLSFGDSKKMKEVYDELDEMAKEVKSSFDELILIASDHGMKPIGKYGEHSGYGFYSVNHKWRLNQPKITDFHNLIKKIPKKGYLNQQKLKG